MPTNLDRARQQFDEGKYKQAVETLWYAQAEVRMADDMEGAQDLLDLAKALHEVTNGSAQRDCDQLAQSAREMLHRGTYGGEAVSAPTREESRPAAWPLVIYGMVAAGAVALFLWAQQASSVSHAITATLEGQHPTLLKQSDANVLEAVCIGLVIGCVVGFVIQAVRFSKATPAASAESPAIVASGAPLAAPQATKVDESPGAADALRDLKTLKDEGLVTDDEYAAKRTEILSRL